MKNETPYLCYHCRKPLSTFLVTKANPNWYYHACNWCKSIMWATYVITVKWMEGLDLEGKEAEVIDLRSKLDLL